MSLTAYYPFTGKEGTAPGNDGTIAATTDAGNQKAGLQPDIDFLWATATGIKAADPKVNFTFAHQMSKLTLSFVSGNEGTDVSKITSYKIDGLVMDGTFDTATGVCAATGDVTPLIMDVTGLVDDGKPLPSLILFPQSTAGKTVTLRIYDNEGQEYLCNLTFTDNALKSGNNYNCKITVSKAILTVNSSITNWIGREESGEASSDLSQLITPQPDPEQ